MQIFTTLVLTQDRLIVAGNVIQGTANSVLLWQTATSAASSAAASSKQQSQLTAEDEDEVCLATCGIPFVAKPASSSLGGKIACNCVHDSSAPARVIGAALLQMRRLLVRS